MGYKVRIRNKEHLEQIFRECAELQGVEFNYNFIIEKNSELTFGKLEETAECIGYENLLIDYNLIKNLRDGKSLKYQGFCIDLIGIKKLNFSDGMRFTDFLGCYLKNYGLELCSDGTLHIWFV